MLILLFENKGMDFPQYRKLSNEKVYYKIIDDRHFDEIQIVGSKAFYFSHIAKQYPEILRIQDMLAESTDFLKCNEVEYNQLLDRYSLG